MGNNNCNSCDSCNSCDYCESCDYCFGCYGCVNVVNGFRCSKVKLAKKDENRYWIFNKEVTNEEWDNRYSLEVIEKADVCPTCGK